MIPDPRQSSYLRYADSEWVNQIMRGFRLAKLSLAALIGLFAIHVLVLVVGMMLIPLNKDTPAESAFETLRTCFAVLIMVAAVGMGVAFWMVSTTEPSKNSVGGPASEWRSLFVRTLAAVAVPAIGLWWFGAVSSGPVVFTMGQQILIHMCFVIVWLAVWLMIRQMRALSVRVAAVSRARLAALEGYSCLALLVPPLLLALCWIGPLRWWNTGYWSGPSYRTHGDLFFAMTCAFVAALVISSRTERDVRTELAHRVKTA